MGAVDLPDARGQLVSTDTDASGQMAYCGVRYEARTHRRVPKERHELAAAAAGTTSRDSDDAGDTSL